MNIIVLNPISPYPADNGGRIVSYNRIYNLAQTSNVYAFYTYDENSDAICRKELMQYCKEVHSYHRPHNPLKNLRNILKGPYMAVSRWRDEMKDDIEKCVDNNSIDVVIVEFPHMLGNLSQNVYEKCKVVLELHNIEWATYALTATKIKNPIKRSIYKLESARLRKLEEQYYKEDKISLYTFVSSKDKDFFEKYYSNKTFLSPIGMSIPHISEQSDKKESPCMIFVGQMSYHPNVDAVKWFADNVFPKLKERHPRLEFYVVGKDPVEEVKALGGYDGITITGTVDSVEPYYQMADIVILPLLVGGGVKVKLLEALAHRKYVVSTSKGAEGTAFQNEKELLVADNPDEFINACDILLNNPDKYKHLKENAISLIRKEYGWNAIMTAFEERLHQIISL